MPCCLTPSTGGREDFLATTGCTVSLSVKATGGEVELVHCRYAKSAIDPPDFDVVKGAATLVVVVEASKAGAMVQLIESCGAGPEQVIDRFHYDPMNPARGYIIRGS